MIKVIFSIMVLFVLAGACNEMMTHKVCNDYEVLQATCVPWSTALSTGVECRLIVKDADDQELRFTSSKHLYIEGDIYTRCHWRK